MKPCQHFVFLLITISLLNAGQAPRIFHQIPDKLYYDQFDWINCVIDPGDYQLLNVNIFIKDSVKDFYTEYPMLFDNGVYVFRLIPEMVRTDSLIYFITAEFSDFALVAFPAENPRHNPVVVPIVREKRAAKVIAVRDVAKLFCDLGRDIDNVEKVTIYTRYGQTGRFQPEEMVFSKGRFQYTVRASSQKNIRLYYYIIIRYNDQTTLSYPSEEFEKNPGFRILKGRR